MYSPSKCEPESRPSRGLITYCYFQFNTGFYITIRSDEENLELIKSTESVDEINAKFYGRFKYPWAPMVFNGLTDPYFETLMLNQSIGSWDHHVVPKNAQIWVAGWYY